MFTYVLSVAAFGDSRGESLRPRPYACKTESIDCLSLYRKCLLIPCLAISGGIDEKLVTVISSRKANRMAGGRGECLIYVLKNLIHLPNAEAGLFGAHGLGA